MVKIPDYDNESVMKYETELIKFTSKLYDLQLPSPVEIVTMSDSAREVFEQQKELSSSIAEVMRNELADSLSLAEKVQILIAESLVSVEEYIKSVHDYITPALYEVQEAMRKLPERMRKALLILGKNGWYIDSKLPHPALWEIGRMLSNGELDEAEEVLCEYYENRASDIETDILKSFPERMQPIKAAFQAHKEQEYFLSIPVLLAQSDGICNELAGKYFFMRSDKKPQIASYIMDLTKSEFANAFFAPLLETLPINANQSERDDDFVGLNRHMVLHGESSDYGTRKNSLKAISLIGYISHVLLQTKEIHNNKMQQNSNLGV